MFVVVYLGALILLLFFWRKKNTSYHTNCFAESILINNVLTEPGQTTTLQTEWVKLETLEGAKIYSHRVEKGHYSHGIVLFTVPTEGSNIELENNTNLILRHKEKAILPGGSIFIQGGNETLVVAPYKPFVVDQKSALFPGTGQRVL